MSSSPKVKKREFPLRRGGNYYIEFDGNPLVLPSVTNILGNTLPKPQLVSWAARTAAKAALENPGFSVEDAAASIYRKKTAATGKGKNVHEWIESFTNDPTIGFEDLLEEEIPYAKAFKQFMEAEQPKFIYAEAVVFNITHGYAGSLDAIAETGSNQQLTMMDWKTGKGVYYESHLQQVAYKNAEYLMTKDKKIIPMPQVKAMFLIHLQNNEKYAKIGVNEPFEDFLKVMEVWKILQKKKNDN